MNRLIALHLVLPAILLAACSALAEPTPTLVPTSTLTLTPAPTATDTATAAPANTAIPPTEQADVLSALLPHGQPDSDWNGIPIMPGAIAGEGDAEAYRFTIKASRDEIQAYYERELARLGWEALGAGEGSTGAFLMFFTDSQDGTLSVSLIPNGDEFLVMLVK